MRNDPTLALCCECGTLRALSSTRPTLGRDTGYEGGAREGYERCIVRRKCVTCRAVTRHAYLRTDPSRDFAETLQTADVT